MIWGHHQLENSRKWGGFCRSQGPAIGSQASFKILSGTAGIPHFFSSSAVLLQWRSKFWNLLGNLSQALETRRTPPIFDYSLSSGGLKSLIWANQSDQKFLTSLYKNDIPIWNHDFRENWLGSLSMAFFHGKSESGSKFQYIIFKYRCHDIG